MTIAVRNSPVSPLRAIVMGLTGLFHFSSVIVWQICPILHVSSTSAGPIKIVWLQQGHFMESICLVSLPGGMPCKGPVADVG